MTESCHIFYPCVTILLFTLVFLVSSDEKPKDKYNCPLNASSPFSWVVMIWDNNKDAKNGQNGEPGTATMGSLVTCNSALTTAYYYNTRVLNDQETFKKTGNYTRFRVIGQYIYDWSSGKGRLNPCYQNQSVINIEVHPKSKIQGERILFDFAVVVMPKPFEVISPTFPTMFFASDTLELLQSIRYVNIIQSETFCTIPSPEKHNLRDWIWHDRLEVRSKPFHSQCIRVLCEQKQAGGHAAQRPDCAKKLNNRLNATMLCMIPNWETRLGFPSNKDGSLYPNVLAGSPLICNGSTLGISNFIKTRGRQSYPDYPQDIFFTITLLRVLPWLAKKIKDHTPQIESFFIEDKAMSRVNIPDPTRLTTENLGYNNFFILPEGKTPFPPPIDDSDQREPFSTATLTSSVCSETLATALLLQMNFMQ